MRVTHLMSSIDPSDPDLRDNQMTTKPCTRQQSHPVDPVGPVNLVNGTSVGDGRTTDS